MSSCHFQKLLPCYFLQFPPTINCGTVLSGRVHCGPRLNTCRKGQGALLLLLPLLLLHSLSSSCSPSSSSGSPFSSSCSSSSSFTKPPHYHCVVLFVLQVAGLDMCTLQPKVLFWIPAKKQNCGEAGCKKSLV